MEALPGWSYGKTIQTGRFPAFMLRGNGWSPGGFGMDSKQEVEPQTGNLHLQKPPDNSAQSLFLFLLSSAPWWRLVRLVELLKSHNDAPEIFWKYSAAALRQPDGSDASSHPPPPFRM